MAGKKGALKRGALILGGLLALLVVVVVVRAATMSSKQVDVERRQEVDIDEGEVARRLAGAIRFETVSHHEPESDDVEAFIELARYLEETYPLSHSRLSVESIEERSRLYSWRGRDRDLKPVVLMGHVDVVPVEEGTLDDWDHPPFAGHVGGGFIWGRGAMDFKVGVAALLEAVEMLLAEGHEPERTILLAFGHDEEVGGRFGGSQIAELLQSRNIEAEMVLDEGLMITRGMMPGVDNPVAVIGVSEKGSLTLEVIADSDGGHSSTPPRHTAVGRLARALHRLEENQFPASIDGPVGNMLEAVGPHMAFGQRLAMANLWLLGPVVRQQLASKRATNALLRTTIAPTTLEGSPQDNVLAQQAKARVNFRIIPGETVESVTARVRDVIDDSSITVHPMGNFHNDPSPVSSTESSGFLAISRAIRQVFPEAILAPSLMVGATDSRYMAPVARDVYRFSPQVLTAEDLPRIHGTNERQSIEGYANMVRFYRQLILELDEMN